MAAQRPEQEVQQRARRRRLLEPVQLLAGSPLGLQQQQPPHWWMVLDSQLPLRWRALAPELVLRRCRLPVAPSSRRVRRHLQMGLDACCSGPRMLPSCGKRHFLFLCSCISDEVLEEAAVQELLSPVRSQVQTQSSRHVWSSPLHVCRLHGRPLASCLLNPARTHKVCCQCCHVAVGGGLIA